jgi:hypothetical protein
MTKFPTKPGPYWVALDDGNGNVGVVLLHVRYYTETNSFEEGALCEFIDGSGWGFEVERFVQGQLVQPGRVVYAGSKGAQFQHQVKVTWHGEAKPPMAALKQEPVSL